MLGCALYESHARQDSERIPGEFFKSSLISRIDPLDPNLRTIHLMAMENTRLRKINISGAVNLGIAH